jgi:hypothetical protein
MNSAILLALVLVSVMAVNQVDALWGYGRPWGGFYGRPWGGFYSRPLGGFYGRPWGGFYGRPYGYWGKRDTNEMTGTECIFSSRLGSMNCNK